MTMNDRHFDELVRIWIHESEFSDGGMEYVLKNGTDRGRYRGIHDSDQGRLGVPAVWIYYWKSGSRRRIRKVLPCTLDIGRVGSQTADVYVRDIEDPKVANAPRRVHRKSGHILIID